MGIFHRPQGLPIYKLNPVVFGLIIANSVVYLITVTLGMNTLQELYNFGALNGHWVIDFGQWWRVITVMFLHGNFLHFAFNTFFGLFILSAALERLIGSVKFSIIYFGGGVLASWAVVAWDIFTESFIPTVGASGAIFAVLGVLLYLSINRNDWFHPRDASSIKGLVLINVIFTFTSPNISIPGHIGGLAAGYILALLFGFDGPNRSRRARQFEDPFAQSYIDPGSLDDIDDVDIVDDDDPFSKYDS